MLAQVHECRDQQLANARAQIEGLIKQIGSINDSYYKQRVQHEELIESQKSEHEIHMSKVNSQIMDKERQLGYLLQDNSKLSEEVASLKQKSNQAQVEISSMQSELKN